ARVVAGAAVRIELGAESDADGLFRAVVGLAVEDRAVAVGLRGVAEPIGLGRAVQRRLALVTDLRLAAGGEEADGEGGSSHRGSGLTLAHHRRQVEPRFGPATTRAPRRATSRDRGRWRRGAPPPRPRPPVGRPAFSARGRGSAARGPRGWGLPGASTAAPAPCAR